MHPNDAACYVSGSVCCCESFADGNAVDESGLPNDRILELAGSVETFNDLLRLFCYDTKALVAVKVLRTCKEPKFIVL